MALYLVTVSMSGHWGGGVTHLESVCIILLERVRGTEGSNSTDGVQNGGLSMVNQAHLMDLFYGRHTADSWCSTRCELYLGEKSV